MGQNLPTGAPHVLEVKVDDVPLHGATNTVSFIRSGEGQRGTDGWSMTLDRTGVIATKGERRVLVPWSRVRLVELSPETKPETKPAPSSKAAAQ